MSTPDPLSRETAAARHELVALGRRYWTAGWLFGTSGNLSARVATADGERVVVTASGRDKGHLGEEDFVELDLTGRLLAAGEGPSGDPLQRDAARRRPSAEASIHLALYRTRPRARVALHVHTVASTLTTPDSSFPASGDLPPTARRTLSGIELLKGWDLWDEHAVAHLPIFENHPDVPRIAEDIEAFYRAHPDANVPALLIAGHGITAWGPDTFTANRHVEVCEFMCRVTTQRI